MTICSECREVDESTDYDQMFPPIGTAGEDCDRCGEIISLTSGGAALPGLADAQAVASRTQAGKDTNHPVYPDYDLKQYNTGRFRIQYGPFRFVFSDVERNTASGDFEIFPDQTCDTCLLPTTSDAPHISINRVSCPNDLMKQLDAIADGDYSDS